MREFKRWCGRFIGYVALVAGVGVGHQINLDVLHRADETVEAVIGVVQEFVAGNDQFPLAVPDRAADQPGVGIFRLLQRPAAPIDAPVERRCRRDRAEFRVFSKTANTGYLFRQRIRFGWRMRCAKSR